MRLLLTTLALLCALAVVARPADADTTIATTGSQLTITAASGVANAVTIGPGAVAAGRCASATRPTR